MSRINARVSSFLDAARWISAEIVVLSHLRSVLWQDWATLAQDQRTMINYLLYFISSLGHQAVMVFFVLSGFLVGGSVLEDIRNGRFSFDRYLINRASRLYVVLIPALALGGLLDCVGRAWLNVDGLYFGGWSQMLWSLNYSVSERLGWMTALANLTFLQTIWAPTFGSNGPLWSLANEFWYYVLFPLLVVPLLAGNRVLGKIHWLAAGLLMGAMLYPEILMYGSVWAMGAWARVARRPWLSNRWIGFALIPLCIVISNRLSHLPLPYSGEWGRFAGDLTLGLSVALTLTALLHDGLRKTLPGRTMHGFFASFSFSLYTLHFPLLLFVCAGIHTISGLGIGQPPNSWRSLLVLTLLFLTLNVYAWVVSLATERHTSVVRAWLFKRIVTQPTGKIPDGASFSKPTDTVERQAEPTGKAH